MASALNWIPDTLYNSAISVVVSNYAAYRRELKVFQGNVLFDIYYKLYKEGRLCQLACEFSNLEVFVRLLNVVNKRYLLHHCFQALMDHGSGIARVLANSYKMHCMAIRSGSVAAKNRSIQVGLLLGGFLSDAGWFVESDKVIVACLELCESEDPIKNWPLLCLECYTRLLHVQCAYCNFREAELTFNKAQMFVEALGSSDIELHLAPLYAEFSKLFFSKSDYNEAYRWGFEALEKLDSCTCHRAKVSVLKQAAKAFVVKRQFKRAEFLIKQAVLRAREYFGNRHPVMADTLIDYGFYLLNADCVAHSINVYQTALETRQCIFGGQNLLVAISHEDLAYALYVHEYSSGKFQDAREHAEKALAIMHFLLPENHLLLSSSKRVKALLLEEIAVDNHNKATERRLLLEAQELHMSALQLAREAFGEMNVQTAKHYGNLGRLYQSMRRFEEAREMHLKAIDIKKQILGPDDYEVALSVGHLASLYNYDMMLFERAEELYLQSINIGINLFGKGYSGLEFDYRGLLRVYTSLGDEERAAEYLEILHNWKTLRDKTAEVESEISPLDINLEMMSLDKIYSHVLEINK